MQRWASVQAAIQTLQGGAVEWAPSLMQALASYLANIAMGLQ